MNYIDLHCHTTASDGLLTPTELVSYAAEVVLRHIAITDHDTFDGIPDARAEAERHGIEIIPGIEINTDVPDGEIHVLGYWFDDGWRDPLLGDLLRRISDGRVTRAKEMVRKLTAQGAPIEFQRVREIARGEIIGRMHVAQALLEAGHIANRREAFDRFIARHGPAYADRFRLTPEDACRAIARSGGLPVLAHPLGDAVEGAEDEHVLEDRLAALIDAGLVGMEAYYPRHTAAMIDRLLGLCREFDLLPTGGSDYHGPLPDKADLGSVYVPRRVLVDLRRIGEQK